tara:strand:- start:175 stop:423 length:249 start_codon:yes stop_codon:yes gene_type:complete
MDERTPATQRELKPLYASSLRLVTPEGYIRCIKCRKAFPPAAFYKKDMDGVGLEDEGFCKDCVKKHSREHLHLTFPNKVKGK